MEIKKLFSKENVAAATNTVKAGAKQHAPTLMLIGATIGLGLTIYEVLKAQPKCDDILAERKKKLADLELVEERENAEGDGYEVVPVYTEEEKKKETRKINVDTGVELALALKAPIATAITTIGLMWGANYIHIKRTRSLTKKLADATALYDISQEALKKYKGNTEEIVGKEKAEEIQKKTDEDIIKDQNERKIIVDPRYTYQLYLDKPTGQIFYSTPAQIILGEAEINNHLNSLEDFVEANILYDTWGMMVTDSEFGEKHGWAPGQIEFYVKSNETRKLPDGRSVVVLEYDYMDAPTYD